jgi:hypothetical protein
MYPVCHLYGQTQHPGEQANMADPHKRTDDLFNGLIEQAESNDTKLLLEGLRWLCIVTEEVGFGVQIHTGEVNDTLTGISGKIDRLHK